MSVPIFPFGPVAQDVVDHVRPVQVVAHLGIESLRPQLVGEFVEPVGEDAEPAAQENHPVLGGERRGIMEQRERRGQADPAPTWFRTKLSHPPRLRLGAPSIGWSGQQHHVRSCSLPGIKDVPHPSGHIGRHAGRVDC
jgi:hypothetical protein